VLNRAAAQQELRPPIMAHKPGTSSTQAARVAPAPSRSRLVVAAWSGIARRPAWKPGCLHPSPPAPLPFQGRGVPGAPATERRHKKAERRKPKDPRSAQQCNCLTRSREQDTSGPAENRKL